MILGRIQAIADAILYEGYALYPYRTSSLKNQRRLTFGTLCPRAYSEAEGGFEPWELECACLIEAPEGASIEATVRFLQPTAAAAEDAGTWDEAVAREVDTGPLFVGDLVARAHAPRFSFSFTIGEARVEGAIELAVEHLEGLVHRVTVRAQNLTPQPAGAGAAGARRRSLLSAHAVLGASGGGFVSMIDPPEPLRALAETCRNARVWPILVGDPGSRDRVLCSPIILYDYPAIAPESPGDLFDGTEMDEMLTLRILTMTEEERGEAGALDARVKALLDRTDGLGPEQLARLHGAVRSLRRVDAAGRAPRTVSAGGVAVGPGARVVLRPSGRADVFDLALAGMTATVATIEQDFEGRVFVTVTLDDDPGADLGAQGLPGHRFFFRPDEVEPLGDLDLDLDLDRSRGSA
ncbi:MAG: hypothetical protein ABJE95_09825 [Byssovorax sp.]